MKISRNKKSIIGYTLSGLLALGGLASCSNEESVSVPGEDKLADAYLELNLTVPSSRSSVNSDGTTSEGTVAAFANEATISSLQLLFCEAGQDGDGDSYLWSTNDLTSVDKKTDNGKTINTARVPVDYTTFANLLAGKKVVVYAVVNASLANAAGSPKDWKLSFADLNSNGLGLFSGPNGNIVPMASAERSAVLDYSGNTNSDIRNFFAGDEKIYNLSNSATAPHIGTITVERAVARIDFKGNNNSNVYAFGNTGLYLKIDKMQPVNVSKEEYLFRHTSAGNATGADAAKATLFGVENGGVASAYNWIADTDWTKKAATSAAPEAGYFFNQPSLSDGVYSLTGDWSDVAALVATTDNTDSYGAKDFHAWCYLAENTLPSTSKMIEGLSTGIAFRAVLCDSQGKALTKSQLLDSNAAWAWALSVAENAGTLTVSDLKSGSRVLSQVDGQDAYSLTYYYWNRHNDVSKSIAKTDPMEFGVVRNHVYKVSITALNALPRVYNPSDADEAVGPQNQDITVAVSVEAWGYKQVEMGI